MIIVRELKCQMNKMQIQSIYNTRIKLENGDFTAVEEKPNNQSRLWIRSLDGRLYVACDSAERINLDDDIEVNSAGDIERHKRFLPKLEWKEYLFLSS